MADDPSAAANQPAIPVTGAQYSIAAGDYHATVTELGAGLRTLSLGGQPIVVGYGQDELDLDVHDFSVAISRRSTGSCVTCTPVAA